MLALKVTNARLNRWVLWCLLIAGTGCSSDEATPLTTPPVFGIVDAAAGSDMNPTDAGSDVSPGDADAGSNTVPSDTDDAAMPSDALDAGAPQERDAGSEPDAGHDPGGADASEPEVRRPRPIEGGHVTAPITGAQPPFTIQPVDLSSFDYVEEEFVLEGEATQYKAEGEQGVAGHWRAVPNGTAPYKTRLLVRRPADAANFNGTVFVEWLNTTGGLDAEVGFNFASEELLRGGYGYVAVSVQQAGVDALKLADAERYGALVHPGDLYCYDIYAQAGAAIGWPGDVDPMGGLPVKRLIAYGESQSAMRMITYVNAVQPLTHVYDGVIIHSRAGWGAPVGDEGNSLLGNGMPVRVRDDSDARVLQFFTESELFLPLGPAFAARQPDTDKLRTWEVAGAAHADQHLLGEGADMGCGGPVNAGQQHAVLKAAVRAMHRWLKDKVAPPQGAPIEVNAQQNAIARDEHGNALGGIRTPAVDVPIATLSGEAAPLFAWNPMCMLFGQTTPFSPDKLRALYPTHQDYVDKVTRAARAAREAGFILPEEEASIVAEAVAVAVPP